jgi:hypothetical protein
MATSNGKTDKELIMKHRDRIMGNMGSLLDNIENLVARLERQVKHNNADETDKAFMEDLEQIIPQLTKFYYSWEERY